MHVFFVAVFVVMATAWSGAASADSRAAPPERDPVLQRLCKDNDVATRKVVDLPAGQGRLLLLLSRHFVQTANCPPARQTCRRINEALTALLRQRNPSADAHEFLDVLGLQQGMNCDPASLLPVLKQGVREATQ